jgi:hypothetical protein
MSLRILPVAHVHNDPDNISVRLKSNLITLMVASGMPLFIASPCADMWRNYYTLFQPPKSLSRSAIVSDRKSARND